MLVLALLMRKICRHLQPDFVWYNGYFNVHAYLLTQKNWSQRIRFMKIGNTIKGRHYVNDWAVGEDSLLICILLDIKASTPCIWQETYQNWLLEKDPFETGCVSSASYAAIEIIQVCMLESCWKYACVEVSRQWLWSKVLVHQAGEIIQSLLIRRQKCSVGCNWVACQDCSEALAGLGCGCLVQAAGWFWNRD